METKHSVLIVESRKQMSDRLVQALRAEKQIGRVVVQSSLVISLNHLRKNLPASIVFIADDFPAQEILHFVAGAKVTPAARDGAFILLFQGVEAGIGGITKHLLGGMDGFISAPFSLEAVQKVVSLADIVRLQNIRKRIEAACQLQLEAGKREIDNCSIDLRFGRQRHFSKDLVEGFRSLQGLSDLELLIYFDILCEAFKDVLPTPVFIVEHQQNEVVPVELETLSMELASDAWEVRAKAANSVVKLGVKAAKLVIHLVPLLNDPNPFCRQRAKRALQAIGTEEATSALKGKTRTRY